jgi:hypothetical protein
VDLGTPEKIAQYEAYNRQLIHLTLADKNCFNVDRIMRLKAYPVVSGAISIL